ncbi:MAG: hypothetical protein WDO73_08145 [Ignavibacteriota bacterium]
MLLVIGALCLYLELNSPDSSCPVWWARSSCCSDSRAISVLPINWLERVCCCWHSGLFILEAKFATHGILGVGGAISMVLGAVMLVDSPLPRITHTLRHRYRISATFLCDHGLSLVPGGARAQN